MSSVNITGTGANDAIVITATGADSISVSLNGSVTAYSNVTQLTIDGGGGNDEVTIVNPDGGLLSPVSGIVVNGGGQPGDMLNVIGGSASSGSHTPGASPDAGTLSHSASEVQQVTVSGASGTFTLTFNGQTTSDLPFNAGAAVVLAALTALPTFGGAGGIASVTQAGNVYSITFGGVFANTGVAQMTASGAAGATATVSTLLNGGANNIAYTGVASVADTVSASTFTINGTSGADTISITDGLNVAGAQTTTVSSPTFDSISFANKTTVTVNGGPGIDTLNFNNPTLASGLATMKIAGVDAVTQTGAINYTNLSLATSGPVTLTNAANDVTNLAASVGTNSFAYHDADDISITTLDGVIGVSSLNGPVTITTTNGPIAIANTIAMFDVSAGTGAVVLTAGSTGASDNGIQLAGGANISGGSGVQLKADHLDIQTAATIDAGSDVVTLLPFQAGTLINFGSTDSAGALGLTDAELDGITASVIRIGDATSGTISFNAGISPAGTGQLELTTGGSIQDNFALLDVKVTNLAMVAGTGIGIGGTSGAIETDISNLEARTNTGGISVGETFGDLTIGGVSPSLAGVQVVNAGDINLTADGSILLAESIVGGTANSNVTLAADNDVTSTANVSAITAPGDNVTVTAGRDILLGNGPGFDNDIRAKHNVTLTAGRDITLAGDADIASDDFHDDNAGGITATAGRAFSVVADASLGAGGIGNVVLTAGANQLVTLASSASGGSLHSISGDVTVNADHLAITGSGIVVSDRPVTLQPVSSAWAVNLGSAGDAAASTLELSDAELDRITANILRIGNFSSTGDLSVSSQITADGHYATLSLRTGGAILDATAGEQTDITVGNLALRAAGIGGVEDLDTAVSKIAISSSSSAAARISNTGALTIGSVDLLNASIGGGVTEFNTTGGPLTVATDLLSKSAMSLSVVDSPAAGDNLVINSGVTVQSNVSLMLLAGDDLTISTGATVQAVGAVSAFIDPGNADPGVGAVAAIGGSLIGSTVAINGAGDLDTFQFNGNDTNEQFVASANGQLLALTRNGGVATNVNDVEHLILNSGAGNDQITINDLSGTDVTGILLDLAGPVGGSTGDGVWDQITINGTANADIITAATWNGTFRALVNIAHADTGDGITVIGGAGNDIIDLSQITPGSMHDSINGGPGDDVITGFGNCDIIGGAGNDAYFINVATDYPIEAAGEGTDAVYASINFTLTPNIENLHLQGTGDLNGTGNNLDNIITGNSAGNVLDGGSGGTDFMYGGLGNDVYLIHGASQAALENPGEGIDTVKADVDYVMGSNLEDLVLLGGAIKGTGNNLSNTIVGNSAANVLDGGSGGADFLYGGVGNDVYLIHTSSQAAIENASEGTDTVKADVDYVMGSNIEDLVLLSGAIRGTGNSLSNTIVGNAAGNVLDGGSGGTDFLYGGVGNDVYLIHTSSQAAIENAGEGFDTVKADVDYVMGSNVEDLQLLAGAVSGTGNNLSNTITGNAGANTLDGGAGGTDFLYGGVGNDTYLIHGASQAAIENANEGLDTVKTDVNYALGSNVENLTLLGAGAINGTGNNLDNTITGNAAGNILDGVSGEDILFGGGGGDTLFGNSAGDQLYGSTGDDLYYLSGGATGAFENPGEGTDWVFIAANYSLGSNVENLQLTGAGSFSGNGNGLDNMMFSNGANCTLFGGGGNDTLIGGTGIDTMYGSVGTDLYYIHNSAAAALENPGEGTDWVYADVSFTLGSNIENLQLTGSGNLSGIGNSLDNMIFSNGANCTLFGGGGNDTLLGGAGIDTMYGSAGTDLYYIHNAAAAALENPGEGTDWVFADVSFTLGSNVENIVLTGAGNVDATGNSGNNRIEGNSGNNNLIGNGGADTFVFAAAGTKHDTIFDFDAANASAGHDLIDLSGRGLSFAGLTVNQVGADTQILIGTDEITLKNVLTTSVDAGDFLF